MTNQQYDATDNTDIEAKVAPPGVHYDVPFSDYIEVDAVNNSLLNKVFMSPRHAHHWLENDSKNDTDSMKKGRVIHSAILEPETFEDCYGIYPHEKRRPTKSQLNAAKPAAKTIELIEWWENFDKENEGRETISDKMRDEALKIRESALSVSAIRDLLDVKPEHKELTLYWEDSEYGCKKKCRLDLFNSGYTIDLKSSREADPGTFQRSLSNYGYHRQGSFYMEGCTALLERAEGHIIIAIDNYEPYCAAIYVVDEKAIKVGQQENADSLQRWLESVNKDEYPGYPEEIVGISLPAWYK